MCRTYGRNKVFFVNDIIKNVRITFNDLVHLSFDLPVESQVEDLKEDLLQVEYPNELLLDVGWYPSFNPTGKFIVSVISNRDWGSPLVRFHASSFGELKKAVKNAVEMIEIRS